MKKNNFITWCLLGFCLVVSTGLNAQKQQKPQKFGQSAFYQQIEEKVQENNGKVRCASYEYDQYLNSVNPKKETINEFESWFAPKIEAYKQKNSIKKTTDGTNIITIPVVVHIIHDNKAYGVDENITDEQILSQITVLNQDFRKMLGTPGHNTNPVGADIEIEFCLAQRTPEGLPTNGINRINMPSPVILPIPGFGNFGTWTMDAIEDELKPSTIWNTDDYLNIWVVDAIEFGSFAGYAQFPVSSGLEGLDEGSLNNGAETDGVVIGHNCFGSSDIYPQGTYMASYDKGRSATHEIGHWLGLRHIWGDNNSCTVDAIDSFNDFCLDTPPSNTPNQTIQGCTQLSTCSVSSMLENYMDYTGDSCQNIFTEDQKTRMRTVLENSPRRNTLINSLGCTPAETHGFDGGIEIVSPINNVCFTDNIPVVNLINAGDEITITSAQISYGVGSNNQVYNWAGNLEPGNSQEITLDSVTFPVGTSIFTASLVNVNGNADDNALNNQKSVSIKKPEGYTGNKVTLTLTTDNYGDETYWNFQNSDGVILYEGGGDGVYGDNITITQVFELDDSDCYTFTILDLGGDGICCDYGQGSYTLTTGSEVIATGGQFGIIDSATFSLDTIANVETVDIFDGITLYPNPTNSILNINITGTTELPENVLIYNTLGQLVKAQKISSSSDLSVDVNALANGVYLIKITEKNQSKTLRFIKQ